MKLLHVIFILFIPCFLSEIPKSKKLSRVRRYLAFPEGAVFSAVFCLTNLMKLPANSDLLSINVNWGIAYELPNETKPILDFYKPIERRRNRRELYGRIEKILDLMGYNGRSCVLRSLCEATGYFENTDEDFGHKLLSLIFNFPADPLLKHEPDIHHIYHYASTVGKIQENFIQSSSAEDKCSKMFKCPFSLIELALGHYSIF